MKIFNQVPSISLIANEGDQDFYGIIDSLIQYEDASTRFQPVFLDIYFSSKISGMHKGTVYYVTLKTPISNEGNWDEILNDLNQDGKGSIEDLYECYLKIHEKHKMVQFAVDSQLKNNSYFKYYLKVDLPLIISEGKNTHLQAKKLEAAFRELILSADAMEKEAFKSQDLSIEQLEEVKMKTSNTHTIINIQDLLPESYEYLDFKGSSKDNWNLAEILIYTHNFPFASYIKKENGYSVEIHYPKDWCDESEKMLLGKWFDYLKPIKIVNQE
jgi:hypothetical protein